MDLHAKRAAEIAAAQAIVEGAKAAARDLTVDECKSIEGHLDNVKAIDGQIAEARKSADLMAKLTGAAAAPDLGGEKAHPLTVGGVGAAFVQTEAFKAFKAAHPTGLSGTSNTPIEIAAKGLCSIADLGIGVKATITTETSKPSAVREPGYTNLLRPDEPSTFLDLVTVGSTDQPYVEYAQMVAETNNAKVVAEGDLKPLSDITTAKQQSKAYTYADGFDVTNQQLADDGGLVALMESRIRAHVKGVVEQKLFNGTGAGVEPLGIMNTTGTLAQEFDTDVVTTLARALETYESNNDDADPQAIVMNSRDIWALRLLKDSQGRYLLGNPLEQGPVPTPWGVPLVKSNKLAQGTALVGRFDSVQYLELEPINVTAFNQHKDYAQRNMAYVRCETRGRQVFYMPREVVVADLTA